MTMDRPVTDRTLPSLDSRLPSRCEIPADALQAPYASMQPETLLHHFQTRSGPRFFPLSRGSSAHVERADKILKKGRIVNLQAEGLDRLHFDAPGKTLRGAIEHVDAMPQLVHAN